MTKAYACTRNFEKVDTSMHFSMIFVSGCGVGKTVSVAVGVIDGFGN